VSARVVWGQRVTRVFASMIETGDALRAENASLRLQLDAMQDRLAELERLADTDALLPVANRRAFMRELERSIQHAERHGTGAAVLYIDLDNLKAINDRYGHHAGDAALLHVSRILRGRIRASDVVARIGGDEFGILLDHLAPLAAEAKAEVLAASVAAQPLDLGGTRVKLGISCGLTTIRADDSVNGLLARADHAMYMAKARRQRSDR
jgi:diguanylate cyclase (GGDEF)-like protein